MTGDFRVTLQGNGRATIDYCFACSGLGSDEAAATADSE